MEQRSETTREAARRREEHPDTRTPGMSREPERIEDERDPALAQTRDLRETSKQKGASTGG